MKKLKRRSKAKRSRRLHELQALILVVSLIVFAIVCYAVGRWFETRDAKPETRGDLTERLVYEETIKVDGVTYRKKRNLTTILLMGVDRDSDAEVGGFRNGGQADFLRLMVIDHVADTVQQLEIDRDTMTPITTLGMLGNHSGLRTAQICLSHGFGDGGKQSCELTREAVSNLLMGVDVDFYVSMSMDGISTLNDWAGGVQVTLEDDFSHVDPAMTKGATIRLMGDQAEIYVRSRRSVGVGTNEARMQRQQAYLTQLSKQLSDQLRQSEDASGALYDALKPYMTTDLPRGRMINEVWAAKDFPSTTVSLPGEHAVGRDGFMEYWLNEDALEETVLSLFYEKV